MLGLECLATWVGESFFFFWLKWVSESLYRKTNVKPINAFDRSI